MTAPDHAGCAHDYLLSIPFKFWPRASNQIFRHPGHREYPPVWEKLQQLFPRTVPSEDCLRAWRPLQAWNSDTPVAASPEVVLLCTMKSWHIQIFIQILQQSKKPPCAPTWSPPNSAKLKAHHDPLGTHHWCQDSWFPDRTRPGWQGVAGCCYFGGWLFASPCKRPPPANNNNGGEGLRDGTSGCGGNGEGPTDSFAFISFPNLRISLISEFGGGTGWTLYPSLSTSFMNVSPSSTGNLIFGFTTSGISSCLTSPNFWTTIHFWDLIIWYYLLRHYFLWLSYLQFLCFLRLPILSGTLLLIVGDLHSNTFTSTLHVSLIQYLEEILYSDSINIYFVRNSAFGIISIIIISAISMYFTVNIS